MALYWLDQKVAVDPLAEPFDSSLGDECQVLQVACDEVRSQESMMAISDKLADLLGVPRVKKTAKRKKKNAQLMEHLFGSEAETLS